MRYHPAAFMLMVWSGCIFLYVALPFQLIDKSMSVVGFFAWALFIFSFCLGTMLVPQPKGFVRFDYARVIDFRKADRYLKIAAMIAVAACAMDLYDKALVDLSDAYNDRSNRAGALLRGEVSNSTVWFQIAFLTYPAGFVYLVRQIVFAHKIEFFKTLMFGLAPVVGAMLSMGGRAPLLYAILVCIFAFKARQVMRRDVVDLRPKSSLKRFFFWTSVVVGVSVAFYYFSAVFFVRAESAGGAEAMLTLAESVWGIGFRGANSDLLFSLVGYEFAYLIFAFSWYLIQGFFMQNFLFTDYDGPLQLGIYGVDLVSALMRRLDGELVARNFNALMDLGTYGFLPSAFGSLFVDFSFFGAFFCVIWGILAALVYQKVRQNNDATWYLLAPFITMGILFSLINTPIGFTNGLVTHLWLLLAFFLARDVNAQMMKDQVKFANFKKHQSQQAANSSN